MSITKKSFFLSCGMIALLFISCNNDSYGHIPVDQDTAAAVHECGNHRKEKGEICEKGEKIYCTEIRADYGITDEAYCKDDCSAWDLSTCTYCNNGRLDEGELCDTPGETILCKDIEAFDFLTGEAYCKSCDIMSLRDCSACNNGILEEWEVCEYGDTKPCSDWPDFPDKGVAYCNAYCTDWNAYDCYPKCGDGVLDMGEECDDENATMECSLLNEEYVPAYFAACNIRTCRWNTKTCVLRCGNGVVDDGEFCDEGLSYTCGDVPDKEYIPETVMKCKNDCSGYDESVCHYCGNGKIDAGEVCELGDTKACNEISPEYDPAYSAPCSSQCLGYLELGNCVNICGNSKIDEGEVCDIALSYSCADLGLGFKGGMAVCDACERKIVDTCYYESVSAEDIEGTWRHNAPAISDTVNCTQEQKNNALSAYNYSRITKSTAGKVVVEMCPDAACAQEDKNIEGTYTLSENAITGSMSDTQTILGNKISISENKNLMFLDSDSGHGRSRIDLYVNDAQECSFTLTYDLERN